MSEAQIKQANELMISIQAEIQQSIERGKFLATILARGTGGREVAHCIVKLQEAGHWLAEGQELFGEEQKERVELENKVRMLRGAARDDE